MKEIKENGEKGEKEKKESDLLSLHFSIFFPLSPYMFFIYLPSASLILPSEHEDDFQPHQTQ